MRLIVDASGLVFDIALFALVARRSLLVTLSGAADRFLSLGLRAQRDERDICNGVDRLAAYLRDLLTARD